MTKESGPRLIAVLSFFWALIFVAVALLLFISRQPERTAQTRDSLIVGQSFPLRGVPPEAFALVGSTLIRVEEEGLAVLDVSGREQSFISFPYRQSQVTAMGEGLLVTPVQGSGYMAVFPDLSTYGSDTREIIYGGDYRDPFLLTFGPSLKGRIVASLFDTRTGSYQTVLTFSSLEWPVSLSFIPGTDQFDVLMLDLSQGKMETRYLRCDFDGKPLTDVILSTGQLFPLRVHLGGGKALFYNEREMVLFDPLTGAREAASLPGIPVQSESAGARLVLLLEEGGNAGLFVTSASEYSGAGSSFQSLEGPGRISCFALTPDGVSILAASGEELLLYNTDTGQVLARQEVDREVARILALSNRHFLVIDEEEAAIITLG
ncbi:MAG: hypothetical protein GX838_04875 [Clostridiaceae bacterium]|nr:hypothetical protein [Clostridiaceae bacterium]